MKHLFFGTSNGKSAEMIVPPLIGKTWDGLPHSLLEVCDYTHHPSSSQILESNFHHLGYAALFWRVKIGTSQEAPEKNHGVLRSLKNQRTPRVGRAPLSFNVISGLKKH